MVKCDNFSSLSNTENRLDRFVQNIKHNNIIANSMEQIAATCGSYSSQQCRLFLPTQSDLYNLKAVTHPFNN